MTVPTSTLETIQAAALVDNLTGASLDELRTLLGRLEDGARIVRRSASSSAWTSVK